MARPRKELDKKLSEILESLDIPADHLYYQPPSDVYMSYPCIRYDLTRPNVRYANNGIYFIANLYDLTVIDEDPDSVIPEALLNNLHYCSFDRHYESDDLHHFTLSLFY